jgi:hypothetical protein
MKNLFLFLALVFITQNSFSQKKENENSVQIKNVISTFMQCLVKKDSVKFYNLFYDKPEKVVWCGVFKEKTQQECLKKDSSKKDNFSGDYKTFYRSISDSGTDEEKFYNIDIKEDGAIATVIFDYSFWENNIKINWGKESWGLMKIDGEWKITSVIFSYETEKYNPEPKKRK